MTLCVSNSLCRLHGQVFINSKYRSVYGGRATTDEEITGFLIATLFAGQHTSSITSSWTGFFMLTNQVQLKWCHECTYVCTKTINSD